MKPLGGKFVNKLQSAHQSAFLTKRGHSLVDINAPLQTKYLQDPNPLKQLQTVKDSFSQMINLLSKSTDKTQQDNTAALSFLNLEEEAKLRVINDSKVSSTIEFNSLEEYRRKGLDLSSTTKNLSFEKPSAVYSQYMKEQGQTSVLNYQTQAARVNQNLSFLKERHTFRNHVKAFVADAPLIDEVLGRSQEQNIDGTFKLTAPQQTAEDSNLVLKCFKNMELECGREDIQTFEKIIKDLLTGKIKVEDVIEPNQLSKIMRQRIYQGFSLAPEIKQMIKHSLKDEYKIDVDELDKNLENGKFYSNTNEVYTRHLRSYVQAVKGIDQFKKDSNDGASVIEQFKDFRAKLKQQQQESNVKEASKDKILVTNEQDQKPKYKSFIMYMALQEMIKQVFVTCRQKGALFLKLFTGYFKEQERQWFEIVQKLCEQINSLKTDRNFLLNKFIDKTDLTINRAFIKDDIKSIIESKEVTDQNLIEHKRLILELIGFVNREEDDKYLTSLEKRNLERDVKDIIYNWDLVRSNIAFKERIKSVNTQKIKEDFNLMDAVRSMKREDQAVLVNLERMRTALSSGTVQWDLEKIQLQGQNNYFKEENAVMKTEMKRLREALEISQENLKERSKENFDLQQRLKKFTSRLDIIVKSNAEIQTDVSFKNEDFTTSLDMILKNKLNNQIKKVTKLMNKAKANINNFPPMSRQEMMELIQGTYIKKSQEINTKNELHPQFDDFLYSILLQRFGTKKKTDHKGQEFLLDLKKYCLEDERVEFFKKFVGFEEAKPYSREILEFYIQLMKSTNESIQNLMSLPPDGQGKTPCEKIHIEFSVAFERYTKIFNNSSKTLKDEMKKHLIFDSDLIIENQPRIEVKLNEKWELHALLIFHKNVMTSHPQAENIEQALIQALNVDEESNIQCAVGIESFKSYFKEALGQSEALIIFSIIESEDFFKKYFGALTFEPEENLGTLLLKIRGMKKIFRERYDFKITVRKFLDLGMKMALRFVHEANEYYGKIFKIYDSDNDGLIGFKEFRKIIKRVDPGRSDWKIHAAFQKAAGVEDSDKGQLHYNDFIKCAMNNILMENMIDWDKVIEEERHEMKVHQLQIQVQKSSLTNHKKTQPFMSIISSGHGSGFNSSRSGHRRSQSTVKINQGS